MPSTEEITKKKITSAIASFTVSRKYQCLDRLEFLERVLGPIAYLRVK